MKILLVAARATLRFGGGSAYGDGRASPILAKLNAPSEDQRAGIDIVRRAVLMALRQIAEKAGEDGGVISGTILDKAEYN